MDNRSISIIKFALERVQEILKGNIGDIETGPGANDSSSEPPCTRTIVPITRKTKKEKSSRFPHGQKIPKRSSTKVTTPNSAANNRVRSPEGHYTW